MNSVSLVHPGTIESFPAVFDDFDVERGMADIFTYQPKRFNELGL
jgi:hypothetical protein